ncbi:MAG: hypothetical protein R3C56_18410 [Pirellulaceae bacterium]
MKLDSDGLLFTCRKSCSHNLRTFFKEFSVPRLLGVDIPNDKVAIALTYLYGVGPRAAREACKNTATSTRKSQLVI